MSERLPEQVRDEIIAKVGGKVAERVIDKTFEIVSGWPLKKRLVVRVSFGILFRFYGSPRYDSVVNSFEGLLDRYRVPSSREVIEIGNSKFMTSLSLRQKSDAALPYILASENVEFDEFLTESISASSAILYLAPLDENTTETSFEALEGVMQEILKFFSDFERGLAKNLEIRPTIRFCKLRLNSYSAMEIVEKLRRDIPNIDSTIDDNDERSIVLQLTDSSIIGLLVRAMEKSL